MNIYKDCANANYENSWIIYHGHLHGHLRLLGQVLVEDNSRNLGGGFSISQDTTSVILVSFQSEIL